MTIYLQLHYTDLLGVLRSITITLEEEPHNPGVEEVEVFIDGSSVYGFSGIEDSDLKIKPVPETLAKTPWERNIYLAISRVYRVSGRRLEVDPRYIAERGLEYTENMGYKPVMGVEIEFFLFNKVNAVVEQGKQILEITSTESPWSNGIGLPVKKVYHVPEPLDTTAGVRREIIEAMKELGYKLGKSHHEVASSGQLEISSGSYDNVRLADYTQLFKKTAKTIALKHGLTAVFLPKPIPWDNGSGMHVHVSLWGSNENLFYDPNDEYGLSSLARYFIGGLIEHGQSLSAIVSPTTNSYKRLVPGYEAPIYLTWGPRNRSTAIRIPATSKPEHTRIEYRPPDPTANPYLAYTAILLAGLDGVKKKIEPPPPVKENVYKWDKSKLREYGIRQLPRNLLEALDYLESDHDYLKPVFSKQVIEEYVELKRKEALTVDYMPTPMEYKYYASLW